MLLKYLFLSIFLLLIFHVIESLSSFNIPHIISKNDLSDEAEIKETKEVKKFEPTWESLDSRVLPEWYDNAKIGKLN